MVGVIWIIDMLVQKVKVFPFMNPTWNFYGEMILFVSGLDCAFANSTSTQEPQSAEMETQPATESQVALSLGGTPTPVSPSSVPSSAGKLAEQEVFCLHQ